MSDELKKNNSFWHDTKYGKELLICEQKLIAENLKNIFGLHILQIGMPEINFLEDNCRINHRLVLSNDYLFKPSNSISKLYSHDYAIPLASDSLDAVIVCHALEFSSNPHAVLREIDRVLLPEGHLVILGFNPWSLWGLRARLTRNEENNKYPWDGDWISRHRMIDWLSLLNFEIEQKKYFYFKHCFNSQILLNTMRFFEQIGKIIPISSAAYCIRAKKTRESMLAIKTGWQKDLDLVVSNGCAEPSLKVNVRDV